MYAGHLALTQPSLHARETCPGVPPGRRECPRPAAPIPTGASSYKCMSCWGFYFKPLCSVLTSESH